MDLMRKEQLIDAYVNFIMDSMPLKLKEEELFSRLVKEYERKTEEEIVSEITMAYGLEGLEEIGYR